MPIPKRKKGESRDKCFSRCMGDKVMVKEFDPKKRGGICGSQCDRRNNSMFKTSFTFKTNFSAEKKVVGGVEFILFPVVAMVEGVHNKLFYSAEEIDKNTALWNGVPITIDHPQSRHGGAIGANTSPELMEIQVGKLFSAGAEGGKLTGQLWIEVNRIKDISPESLSAIEAGRLEVSIGLFSGGDGTKGVWKGEEFEETLYGFIPDHIALLPNGIGACSWADGCGVRENERKEMNKDKFFNLNNKGGKIMPIAKERIDALFVNKFLLPDDEGTRTYLTNMDEKDFEALEECGCGEIDSLRENAKKAEDEKAELVKVNAELTEKNANQKKAIEAHNNTDKDKKKEDMKINKEELKKEVLADLKFEDVLASAPKEVKENIEAGIATNKARKASLIKALDGSPFTNEELEGKNIAELEKLIALGSVETDYSTRLGNHEKPIKKNEKQDDGSGVPTMIKIGDKVE